MPSLAALSQALMSTFASISLDYDLKREAEMHS